MMEATRIHTYEVLVTVIVIDAAYKDHEPRIRALEKAKHAIEHELGEHDGDMAKTFVEVKEL